MSKSTLLTERGGIYLKGLRVGSFPRPIMLSLFEYLSLVIFFPQVWFCPEMEFYLPCDTTEEDAKKYIERRDALSRIWMEKKAKEKSFKSVSEKMRALEAEINRLEGQIDEDSKDDVFESLQSKEISLIQLKGSSKTQSKELDALRDQHKKIEIDIRSSVKIRPRWANVTKLWKIGSIAVVEPDRCTVLAIVPAGCIPEDVVVHPLLQVHKWVSPTEYSKSDRTEFFDEEQEVWRECEVLSRWAVSGGKYKVKWENPQNRWPLASKSEWRYVPGHMIRYPLIESDVTMLFETVKVRETIRKRKLQRVLDRIVSLEEKNEESIEMICETKTKDSSKTGLDGEQQAQVDVEQSQSSKDSQANIKAVALEKIAIRKRKRKTLQDIQECTSQIKKPVLLGGPLDIRYLPINAALVVGPCMFKKGERFQLKAWPMWKGTYADDKVALCSPAPLGRQKDMSEGLKEWIGACTKFS